MMLAVSAQSAKAQRIPRALSGGGDGWTSAYFGPGLDQSGTPDAASPQAFMVEQEPGSIIRPHFHVEDQFQLVVRGGGSLGSHPIESVFAHYANHHNGYGPIVAGERGLAYLTLRDRADSRAWYLPDERARMNSKAPRRQMTAGPVALTDSVQLAALQATDPLALFRPTHDGVGAWSLSLGNGAALPDNPGAVESGRFIVPLSGTIWQSRHEYEPWSVLYLAAGEFGDIAAGTCGAQVIVMQFAGPPLIER